MAQMSRAEQQRANEIQDYLRGLGAREAAAIAPRLTAGLSAGAASAIQHTAQRRVNQTRDIAQEWTEADTRQQRLESRRLDEFRQRQQARQQAEQRREQDYQAWVRLQQFCDDMRRMNDRQVKAHFTAAMTDDRTFAAARESLRAALVAQSTEAFLLRKRQAALANGTPPADVATFDMLRSMLSGDQMKTIIREALIDARPVADEPPAVAAVKAAGARETIEQRLMAVLDVSNAALTSEQRRAFETSIRSSLLDHFQEFGLSAGVALTVAEIEAHAESLRGRVTNALADLLLDDGLGLNTEHYCAMLNSINASIDGLSAVPAHQREAAVDAMMIGHQQKMVGSGLDASLCTPEAVMAQAARTMYDVAARVLADPEAATEADLDMARAMAEIAARRPDLDLQPAAPAPTAAGVLGRLHARRAAVEQTAEIEAPQLR